MNSQRTGPRSREFSTLSTRSRLDVGRIRKCAPTRPPLNGKDARGKVCIRRRDRTCDSHFNLFYGLVGPANTYGWFAWAARTLKYAHARYTYVRKSKRYAVLTYVIRYCYWRRSETERENPIDTAHAVRISDYVPGRHLIRERRCSGHRCGDFSGYAMSSCKTGRILQAEAHPLRARFDSHRVMCENSILLHRYYHHPYAVPRAVLCRKTRDITRRR